MHQLIPHIDMYCLDFLLLFLQSFLAPSALYSDFPETLSCLFINTLTEHILISNDPKSLQWRHNRRDCVSNHQGHDCLLNRFFGRRSKKTPKLRDTGFCAGKSPMAGEFLAQMCSYAENVSIWWRKYDETSRPRVQPDIFKTNHINNVYWFTFDLVAVTN